MNGEDCNGASVIMDGRVCHEDDGMVEFDKLVACKSL